MKLTPLGVKLMEDPKLAKIQIYELIIKHELIGKIFAKRALYSREIVLKEGKDIVRSLYPEYGEAVIERRTKCLIGWCEEIIEFIKVSE